MENKSTTDPLKSVTVRACNKKELQALLGVSLHILNKWLDSIAQELGEPICGLYSARQVQLIIDRFGIPDKTYRPAA